MPNIMVYIETVEGNATPASLELISGARALSGGGRCVGVVIGDTDTNHLLGLDTVLVYEAVANGANYSPERDAIAIHDAVLRVSPDLILISNSLVGLDQAAVIAAEIRSPLVCYCNSLEISSGMLLASALTFGGKAVAKLEAKLPAVASVNPGAFRNCEPLGIKPILEHLALPPYESRVSVKSQNTEEPGLDITSVAKLVCVGRGIGEENNIDLAVQLAVAIDGELAASRPVVDLGWVEKSRQVGKSGRTVKPKLYLALGVSGAPEHLEGMRDSDLIIAVNSDENAPIFDVAHIGTTCDVMELLPVLIEQLEEIRA